MKTKRPLPANVQPYEWRDAEAIEAKLAAIEKCVNEHEDEFNQCVAHNEGLGCCADRYGDDDDIGSFGLMVDRLVATVREMRSEITTLEEMWRNAQ